MKVAAAVLGDRTHDAEAGVGQIDLRLKPFISDVVNTERQLAAGAEQNFVIHRLKSW